MKIHDVRQQQYEHYDGKSRVGRIGCINITAAMNGTRDGTYVY
jgi:hypothetical protein